MINSGQIKFLSIKIRGRTLVVLCFMLAPAINIPQTAILRTSADWC